MSRNSSRGNPSSSGVINVVVAPDFSAGQTIRFEARVLFLLASWLNFGAASNRQFTLQIACVGGDPPNSVCWLAQRAGAQLSRHHPIAPAGGYGNKLRGLEVSGLAGPVLLLDADILVLTNLSTLPGCASAQTLAAAPAGHHRISDHAWKLLYAALDVSAPEERMITARAESGLDPVQPMFPYFNSGVLLTPENCPLKDYWMLYLSKIEELRAPGGPLTSEILPSAAADDMVGLAVALQRLKVEGWNMARLAHSFNVRPLHFQASAVKLSQTNIFHAVGFLRDLQQRKDIEHHLEAYTNRSKPRLFRGVQKGQWANPVEHRLFTRILRQLYNRHVRPAYTSG